MPSEDIHPALALGQAWVLGGRGCERLNHINSEPMQSIYRRWIELFEALSSDSVLRLKRMAEKLEETIND